VLKLLNKFHHSINFFKIRTKLLFLITLAIVISVGILSLISFSIYSSSIKEKAIEYNITEINKSIENIDLYFNQIEFMASTLAYNNSIQDYLTHPNIVSDGYNASQDAQVRNLLYLISTANINLQITLFFNDAKSLYYSTGFHPNIAYDYKEDDWYKIIEKSKEQKEIVINNPQDYLETSREKGVYTLVYRCLSFDRNDILGYMLMDVNKNAIDRFFQTTNSGIISTLILDKNNDLVYNNISNLLINNITHSLKNEKRNGYLTQTIKGTKYFIVYGTSVSTGWKIINIFPYKSLFKDISYMKYLIIAISLLLLIITILVTYHYTRLITKPLEKLKDGMDEVYKGNIGISLSEESNDEIAELLQHFNRMTNQIQHLINQAESSKLLMKDAELKALQQQINPHFLYNTLEMIIGLTHEENAKKIRSICRTLGSMFRYNLISGKTVTVEEELKQVKRYVYIMEQRFEGRFEVFYEIDKSLLKYKTLKFFLQPLVENAISYGFSDIIEGGELTIKIVRNANKIEFDIIDNGHGFNLERLSEININLQTSMENPYDYIDKYNHIGIMNVHLRLLMLFKLDCSMNIQSIPLKETCVKILIPITT